MSLTHRPRDRRGFALALALVSIVVVGAMVAGGYLAGVQEFRMGRNSLVQQRAMAATELGLDSVYSTWNRTWNSLKVGMTLVQSYRAPDGSWVDTVRITKLNQLSFLVVSEGYAGGTLSQLSSRRRTAMLVRLNMPTVRQIGALTTRGNVFIGGSTAIQGNDTSVAGWGCPPAGAPIAGVAVPAITNLSYSGSCAGGVCLTGSPLYSTSAAAADTNTYFSYGTLTWPMLVAMADKQVSGVYTGVKPSWTGGVCNTADNNNWGDPTRAVSPTPAGPCEGYFPILYSNGNLTVNGNLGQGILLVNGNLNIQGGFTFYGQIIARGTVKFTGTGNHVLGGVMAAAMIDSTDASKAAGNSTIRYSRCTLNSVFSNTSMGTRAPQRSWIELF